MQALSSSIFDFINLLKENNNRDWFKANKHLYDNAKAEFEVFIDGLIQGIAIFDPTIAHHKAKDCVFRIYRDVRFSKNKSPYKTNFGAHITAAAKKSDIHTKAGYYIHIEPGASMLAGGAYTPKGPWLKAIRQEIAYNADEFREILNHPDFKKYFGILEGAQLKTAPRDYPKDHPEIELLRYKSFLATHRMEDEVVQGDHFLDHSISVFKALYPFDAFLNRSMD